MPETFIGAELGIIAIVALIVAVGWLIFRRF